MEVEDDDESEELSFTEELHEGSPYEQEVVEKKVSPKALTQEEACSLLSLLGKPADALGIEVAYLQIKATEQMLTDISVISTFTHVMFVDVSRNLLNEEALAALGKLKYLVKLHANGNLLTSCKLPTFPNLQVLTLNQNKIEVIDGLDCPVLTCLEIRFNRVNEIKNIRPPNFKNLKVLDLGGNYLDSTKGIECPTLERLYLANNNIVKIKGLKGLQNLEILHLRNNPLQKLKGLSSTMSSLSYINVRNCQIQTIKEIRRLSVLPKLETLIISENPIYDSMEDTLRIVALSYIPSLKRINKGQVQKEEIEDGEMERKRREGLQGEEAEEEELSEEEEEEEEKGKEEEEEEGEEEEDEETEYSEEYK